MKIINNPEELRKNIEILKKEGKTVGLVPTMGALHYGHISLMKQSVLQNDITVVSVYVNPIQFGPNEDYERYPRPIEKDIQVCQDNKDTQEYPYMTRGRCMAALPKDLLFP